MGQSRHRHQLLALALLALYASVTSAPGSSLQTTFILLHFAAVLLWQPFLHGSTEVGGRTAVLTLAVGIIAVLWTSWLVLAGWLLVLIGLIGGEHTRRRPDQVAQWLVVAFLFIALLAGVTPPLFAFEAEDAALRAMVALSGVLPLGLLFLHADPAGQAPRFDYLRSVSTTLFALMLAVGSVLWTYRSGRPYPQALIEVLLVVGVLTLVIDWIWRRKAGHTMFRVLFDQYLLNLGSPFEHYLSRLSGSAARALDPDAYLDRALAALDELDWVRGVEMSGPAGERLVGERTEHMTEAFDRSAPLAIYTDRDPGPALRMHIQLLARLVQQFYLSRRHEAELRHQEKARVVHETGARLTHDIKNLLQSLQSLSAAVSHTRTEDPEAALGLVQRQLPYINQRLQATLEKLRDPAEARSDGAMPAEDWWRELQTRYADGSVEFDGRCAAAAELPRELFDTVAENLLENARYKQSTDRRVRIRAELIADPERVCLRITDTGAPVPERTARQLFGAAVSSSQGLGIGLHQCARLAERLGYDLRLETNESGNVCFRLRADEGSRNRPEPGQRA